MNSILRQKRQAALIQETRPRLALTDTQFNMREICKQLLLLEDHLFHREKQCPDCVVKHLLTVEALSDEALTFENVDLRFEHVSKLARKWLCFFADRGSPRKLANAVRKLRKKLTSTCFDPRAAVSRVASVLIARGEHNH